MLILLATLFSMTAAAQKIDCSGTIVDTNGEPIIGASVYLKGESKGAVSDLNGVFKLQQVPEGSMITVSYIGYKTVETKAEADMRIVMHEDNELLNEVVVVGYGVQKKSVVTASIAKVSADDLAATAPVRMDNALKGLAAGVTVTSSSGQPGAAAQIRVRGIVTVASSEGSQQISVVQESAPDNNISVPEGYRLVWNDEFDQGTTLNTAWWTHEEQGPGWVNNELQTYVDGQAAGRRVTEIADGKLSINCFKAGSTIYSGRVYANVSKGWKYGWFEARIKLPKGKGTWPAFWMMPANNDFTTNPWPLCGEIDIMEEVGADPGDVSSTIHCQKYNNTGTATEHATLHVADAEDEFHVYACEWTSDHLKFYVDGKMILDYANDGSGIEAWPFDKPFYIILNLAWGGDWGGYKGTDDSALPATMKIDYVRVFQK